MVKIWNNESSKMILNVDWHTEDINSEHLSFSVFSTGNRSKNSCINDRHIVFISRRKKITDEEPKEYGQSCKEQSYLNELLQTTWCIFAKQKYGKATDLSIATYENVFDYLFNFAPIMLEKGVEPMIRLCLNNLSKYQKLSMVYLNIYYRYIGLRKGYLQGYFHFHISYLKFTGEVLKKNENGKT